MEKVVALTEKWKEEARVLCRRGDVRGGQLLTDVARELAEAIRTDQEQPLTLKEAADFSGYSADHLGRLIREGKLTNVGREGAPRVRRHEVPRKQRLAARTASSATQSDHLHTLVRDIANSKLGA